MGRSPTVGLAMALMRLRERVPPDPAHNVGLLSEVFSHPVFTEADQDGRREVMLASARAKYEGENAYPLDHYFGMPLRPMLEGKVVLDLGCFTGGVSAAWQQRYGIRRLIGVDVREEYIEAAQLFAKEQSLESEFRLGRGEKLPLADDEVDAILSFDVLEHVRDVRQTLAECQRVLAPGGRFALVFPSYWHPLEHHLSLVSGTLGLHYLFRGRTLIQAYNRILEGRGENANWYKRSEQELEAWERGNTINGMTLQRFLGLLDGWEVERTSRAPIGSIGRNVQHSRAARVVGALTGPLTRVPGARELALHRLTFVLRKPSL